IKCNKRKRVRRKLRTLLRFFNYSGLLGADNYALSARSASARIYYSDTDDFGDNPTELQLLWLVCWEDFDVLTDWHDADKLRVGRAVYSSGWNNLADHNVGTPNVSVQTSLKNFTHSNRIEITATNALSTTRSPLEDVSELVDVHEVLGSNQVPTIDLLLDF